MNSILIETRRSGRSPAREGKRRSSASLSPQACATIERSVGGSIHGSENVLYGRWRDIRGSSTASSLAHSYWLARIDRKLVGADVAKLDWRLGRRNVELLWAEPSGTQVTPLTLRLGYEG